MIGSRPFSKSGVGPLSGGDGSLSAFFDSRFVVQSGFPREPEERLTMFGFGMPEMILVLIIALVVVGPSKLPQLGQALGSSIRNFKKATAGEDVVKLNDEETKSK
jgi:sec-independent protein translocase protein TatA